MADDKSINEEESLQAYRKEIQNIIEETVPEKTNHLRSLWKSYEIALRECKPGFNLETIFASIVLDRSSLPQVWGYSWLCWEMLRLHASFVFIALKCNFPFSLDEARKIPTQHEHELAMYRALDGLRTYRDNPDLWPSMIPIPPKERPNSKEDVVVWELTKMAIAFMFLHEMKHLQFSEDDNAPSDRKKEELACDLYAIEFILNEVDEYTKKSGEDFAKVYSKRAMAILLALFFIMETTSGNGVSDTHPSAFKRLEQFIERVELDKYDHFWLYASGVLITELAKDSQLHIDYEFNSYQNLFNSLFQMYKEQPSSAV